MLIAYRLRKEYDNDDYLGGVLATGNDSVDVRKELAANDGVILVPDHEHLKLAVLDDYAPLERDPACDVGDGDAAPAAALPVAPADPPELAPGQVLAADGQPIDVPDGVVPGETPGWPTDEEGRVLRLDDAQRQQLAAEAAALRPETPPASGDPASSRAGRRSTPSESKE